MSNITNIIFVTSVDEDISMQALREISSFVDMDWQSLKDEVTGGTKILECEVYVGAFNYFDENKFIDELKSIKWNYPEELQVMVKREDDDQFTTIFVGE